MDTDAAAGAAAAATAAELPAPLWAEEWAMHGNQRAGCYHLARRRDARGEARSSALPWTTCSLPAQQPAEQPADSCLIGDPEADESPCPTKYEPPLGAALAPVWSYCAHSVGDGKPSPGVDAFTPGATLLVPLPVAWLATEIGAGAESSASAETEVRFTIMLQHLVSWRAMGVARVRCTGSCACEEHEIDAHRVSETRNATVFVEHRFGVRLPRGAARCGLSLQVRDHGSHTVRRCSISARFTYDGGHFSAGHARDAE